MVEKKGSEWLVLNHTGKKILGKHGTKEEAEAQLRAVEMHKHENDDDDYGVEERSEKHDEYNSAEGDESGALRAGEQGGGSFPDDAERGKGGTLGSSGPGPGAGVQSAHKRADTRTVRRYDYGQSLKRPERMDNGFMRVDGYVTRSGVFEYRNADGSMRREYRPAGEVFGKQSMDSFDRAPVTNEHPMEGFVSSSNRQRLSVGTVGNIRRDGQYLAASLQVEDDAAIAALEGGKQQISCGYYCDLEETSGISPEGERYDAVQHNIRGNHIALVSQGRAGPLVRVRMDNKDAELVPFFLLGESNVKLTIDGVEIELLDTGANVVKKALADRAAATTSLQAKLDAANEELKKRADAADPKRLDAAVTARVALLTKAQEILGESPKTESSERDIKVAVIQKLNPGFKADGRDDAYVAARYDAVLDFAATEAGAAWRQMSAPIPAPHADSADDARKKFEERNQNAWKTASK
jgi:hypothetical protein